MPLWTKQGHNCHPCSQDSILITAFLSRWKTTSCAVDCTHVLYTCCRELSEDDSFQRLLAKLREKLK